ncbi:MAG: UDP-N-acetylmuramoyl-L-alanine--D-glutamate ligase [Anaerolineae bacterium]|nr:UDP-N-acetylmuramoyl-L-alanine--D-glutamate ligase [Anaerolineae bacterium]
MSVNDIKAVNKVVILGLARQGLALARFFAAQGVHVSVSDRRSQPELEAELAELAEFPVHCVLGEHPLALLDQCDLLCVSGGVPLEIPIVQEALNRGIPLSNDAQEFLSRCPATVVGITGSAGKTTTTSLVGRMVEMAGFTTWVGGNIGNPLIADLDHIRSTDRVIMELSSFQLELMSTSPKIAAVLNITPNHLDRHKTMESYIAAKSHIVRHQRPSDVAILGYDEPNAQALSTVTKAQVRYFSGTHEVSEGAFLRGDALMLRHNNIEKLICHRDELRLRGFHNVTNVLAACALADSAGVPISVMREAIQAFTGVPHRLEEVCIWNNILWINDSIATAPERVLAALNAFTEPLVLLAGGRDKDLPWEEYARRVIERVRVLIVFGEASSLIRGYVEQALAEAGTPQTLEVIYSSDTLERAVETAARWARPGEVVLFSPGGTSFDAYRDFAARGQHFRTLVQRLGTERPN